MATSYADIAALESAIYTWLSSLLAIIATPSPPMIWADENGPQPKDSFLSLNLITRDVMLGSSDAMSFNVGVDKDRFMEGNRMATLSVNAYGKLASNILFQMKQHLETEFSNDLEESANLALISSGDVVDVTALEDTKMQKRCQMDLLIGYTTSTLSGSGNVASVGIEDEINGSEIIIGP